jgi:hypothetical protein
MVILKSRKNTPATWDNLFRYSQTTQSVRGRSSAEKKHIRPKNNLLEFESKIAFLGKSSHHWLSMNDDNYIGWTKSR